MDSPKPRPIVLDVAVLAYLGDYIIMIEKGIEQIANQEQKKIVEEKKK